MIILPIGHDEMTVRRLPWVTLALALVCIGVQVRATLVERSLAASLSAAKERLENLAIEALARRARETGKALPSAGRDEPRRHHLTRFPGMMDEDLREQVEKVRAEIKALQAQHPVLQLGFVPATSGPARWVTYAFAHGGWLHLLLNLLLLYLVGCNLEDRWGRLPFLAFYLAGALVAALAFRLWHPGGATPLVGASGAIAAAMGGFLVFFWGTRLRFFYWIWVRFGTFEAPVWGAFLFWLAEQLWMSWMEAHANLGVAYSAHVGGFVFGLGVGLVVRAVQRSRRSQAEKDEEAHARELRSRVEGAPERRAVAAVPDNDMEQALALAGRGMNLQAFGLAERIVRDKPEDLAARALALRLAEDLGEDAALSRHVAGAFALWVRAGMLAHVAETYQRLRAARPAYAFDERALLEVIGVGRTLGDPALMLDAAAEMAANHPDSRQAPRVLWLAAEAQAALGRMEHATATLRSLVTRFPADPLAMLARRKLESPQGVASPL